MRKTKHTQTAIILGLILLGLSPLPGQGRYVRLQGAIKSSKAEAALLPFHLDAYRVAPDSQRQLVRLSRFTGPGYHLYLEAGYDHEVVIQMIDHPAYKVRIEAIKPSADTERLVLQKDFVVPLSESNTHPMPPAIPEEAVVPVLVGSEDAPLFEAYGDTSLIAVQLPPLPKGEVLPVAIPFEEELWDTDFGKPVSAEAPVRAVAYSRPPAVAPEPVVPMMVKEETGSDLSSDYGSSVAREPVWIGIDPSPDIVATIEMTTAIDAPEHPYVYREVVKARLPPAPRRVRLRMPASLVAGLGGGQQKQLVVHLPEGREVQIIEYTTPEWWMVSYGSLIGWVESQYLE